MWIDKLYCTHKHIYTWKWPISVHVDYPGSISWISHSEHGKVIGIWKPKKTCSTLIRYGVLLFFTAWFDCESDYSGSSYYYRAETWSLEVMVLFRTIFPLSIIWTIFISWFFLCRLIFLRFFAQIMSGYRNFIVSHHAIKFSDFLLYTTFFGGNSILLVRIMLYKLVSMLKHSLKSVLEQRISLSSPCRWYAYDSCFALFYGLFVVPMLCILIWL